MQTVKRPLRLLRRLAKAIRYDLERRYWAQWLAPKPHVINLLANDICNSRCAMCLIWKQKRTQELTPVELEQILRDPLFSNVRFVGITGGEPTLRRDLPELFDVV